MFDPVSKKLSQCNCLKSAPTQKISKHFCLKYFKDFEPVQLQPEGLPAWAQKYFLEKNKVNRYDNDEEDFDDDDDKNLNCNSLWRRDMF